jgi:general secretion pathway protein C
MEPFQKYSLAAKIAMVLLGSYGMARSTTYMTEATLLQELAASEEKAPVKAANTRPQAATRKDASGLLSHNIFYSGYAPAASQPASEPAAPIISDAPADCSNATQDPSGAKLNGTVVAKPSEFSHITVTENGSKGTSVYWLNDKAFDDAAEVYEIHPKKVFFKRATGCTYLALGEQSIAKPVLGAPPPIAAAPPVPGEAPTMEGISKLSETSYEVSRALLDSKMSDLGALASEARAIPNMKNGEFNGFKLYAIRSTSVFAQLGLKNGDVLQSVNGEKVDSLDKAMSMLKTLSSASSVQLGIQRRGANTNLDYSIR